MKRDSAARIATVILEAQAAIEAAVTDLDSRVSPEAADLCFMYLTDPQVAVGLQVLVPLFDEHPDLKPPSPELEARFRRCTVPAEHMAPLRKALHDLRHAIDEAHSSVEEGASTPGERVGYLAALADIRDKLQEADERLSQIET